MDRVLLYKFVQKFDPKFKTLKTLNNTKNRFKKDIFSSIDIETYAICNRKCSFCPITYDNNTPGKMTSELFYNILSNLKEMNYMGRISLSCYGEPLLDTRIEEFASAIKKNLISKISISTNGDFLTLERIETLVSSGVDSIIISQHDLVIPKKLQNLLIDIPKKYSKNIVFQKLTEEEPLVNRGGSVSIKKSMERNLLEPWCGMMYSFFIRYDGEVRLCCNDYFNEIKLGNINKNTIIEIWNTIKYRKIRNNLKRGIFHFEICKKCKEIKNG